MDINDLFDKWYATEGVRYLVPNGEHWHQSYQKVAFQAGFQAAINRYIRHQERKLQIHERRIRQIKMVLNKIK